MSNTRDAVVRSRLNKMTEWAEQRRIFLANPPAWWKDNYYIRIGGNGYTAVSLDDKSPLLGFAASSCKNINSLEKHFAKGSTGEIKPERRAQASLIKQALNNKVNKLGFKESLGLKSNAVYDEIFFALDEVSIGDKNNPPVNRTDILAVGIHGGIAYPVLIELKYGRHLTGENDLIPQFKRYASDLKKFEPEFKQLLRTCVGWQVNFSKIGKIMVWPKSPSGQASPNVEKECAESKVTLIESDTDSFSSNKSFSFHPVKKVYPPVPFDSEL